MMTTEIRNLIILWVISALVGLMIGMGYSIVNMQSNIVELQSIHIKQTSRLIDNQQKIVEVLFEGEVE